MITPSWNISVDIFLICLVNTLQRVERHEMVSISKISHKADSPLPTHEATKYAAVLASYDLSGLLQATNDSTRYDHYPTAQS